MRGALLRVRTSARAPWNQMCLCGPSARVTAAAAAAAQAGAALGQTISHQTWDAFSLMTVIQVMCSQHIFIQTSWEAAATSLSFILIV